VPAKGGIKVRITDTKLRSSVAALFGSKPAAVKVGIFGATGEEPVKLGDEREGGKKAKELFEQSRQNIKAGSEPKRITVAELATIHEFGLGVPERSFIRSYFDANTERVRGMLFTLMQKEIMRTIKSGQPFTDRQRLAVLDKLGLAMQREIQARIANSEILPPLDSKTIDRKGSSTPLIDTGQLRSSITFQSSLDGFASERT
jgi:hypothetical protein